MLAVAASAALPSALYAQPAFDRAGPITSDAGNTALHWTGTAPFRVRMTAADGQQRTMYEGSRKALFVSGLRNGEYLFTLTDGSGQKAAPLTLTVAHQSLSRALWLVAIGALVTSMVVAAIVRGARDE